MSSSKSAACMRPELVEGCTLTLNQRTSTSLSPHLRLHPSTGPGPRGSAHVRPLSGCGHEVPEHLSLHGIRCCRVFWMPLDAEIPACMIL